MEALKSLVQNRRKQYEVAINTNYGGFSITEEMRADIDAESTHVFDEDRANPVLIDLVKKFKPENLRIETLELEDMCASYLVNYDGKETITYGFEEGSRPLLDYIKG